jgi:hypothetical protein
MLGKSVYSVRCIGVGILRSHLRSIFIEKAHLFGKKLITESKQRRFVVGVGVIHQSNIMQVNEFFLFATEKLLAVFNTLSFFLLVQACNVIISQFQIKFDKSSSEHQLS